MQTACSLLRCQAYRPAHQFLCRRFALRFQFFPTLLIRNISSSTQSFNPHCGCRRGRREALLPARSLQFRTDSVRKHIDCQHRAIPAEQYQCRHILDLAGGGHRTHVMYCSRRRSFDTSRHSCMSSNLQHEDTLQRITMRQKVSSIVT